MSEILPGRKGVLLLWVMLLGALVTGLMTYDVSPLQLAQRLSLMAENAWWAGPVFVIFFVLRTVTFFSTAVMAVAAGAFFGVGWGCILTLVGAFLSALLGHFLGSYFDVEHLFRGSQRIRKFARGTRRKGFKAVLVAHLVHTPFDVVNVLAGSLGVDKRPFLKAAMLGSLPGFLGFVFLGHSSGLSEGSLNIQPAYLVVATLLLLVSIAFSEWLNRRKRSIT